MQFIVPTDRPGVTIEPIILMNGEHHFNEVLFDDVALSDGDLLGDVGDGWHQVTSELGFERSELVGSHSLIPISKLLVRHEFLETWQFARDCRVHRGGMRRELQQHCAQPANTRQSPRR